MSSIDYVELLWNRSRLFYEYAREASSRGHYDMTVFYAEQALQLRLKSLALRLLGYVPRLHSVRELLGLILKFLDSMGRGELAVNLRGFCEEYREVLRSLDEAYTAARYLPKTYDERDAIVALEVVGKAMKLIDGVECNVFS